jgi:uncharacterized membrane protein
MRAARTARAVAAVVACVIVFGVAFCNSEFITNRLSRFDSHTGRPVMSAAIKQADSPRSHEGPKIHLLRGFVSAW